LEKYNSQRLLVQKAVSKTRLFYWAALENEFEQFSPEKCVHYCEIGSKIQNMEAVEAYELKESVASRKIVLFSINLKVDRTIRFLPAVSDLCKSPYCTFRHPILREKYKRVFEGF